MKIQQIDNKLVGYLKEEHRKINEDIHDFAHEYQDFI